MTYAYKTSYRCSLKLEAFLAPLQTFERAEGGVPVQPPCLLYPPKSGHPDSIERRAIEVEVADLIVAVAPVELLISFE